MFLVEMDSNESPHPFPLVTDIRNQEWSLPGTVVSLDVFKIQIT